MVPQLKEGAMPPEVIILTGAGDPDGAALAIKNGAWDYLQKPLSPKKILLPLQRVLKYRDTLRLRSTQPVSFNRCGIVGESPAIHRALEKLATAARSDSGVLITGETGTGKELFARAVHENSNRAKGAFIVVDCASIPGNLLESTLFGHVKGAFTGADKASQGLILEAGGGTLFLDEIGEMPLDLQKKLLRVLQEKRYRPVGGSHEVKSDFRLVSATLRNLEAMVEKGEFRRDLMYRLGVMSIELPPLRRRMEDLEILTENFLDRIWRKLGAAPKSVSHYFMEALRAYDWPGNVRELANTLESAAVKADGLPEMFAGHLPEQIRINVLTNSMAVSDHCPEECMPPGSDIEAVLNGQDGMPTYKDFRNRIIEAAERRYFARLMEQSKWDVKSACQISGLGKSRLYYQLKKYGVEKA
jgi:two-component system NtrC family response regulator